MASRLLLSGVPEVSSFFVSTCLLAFLFRIWISQSYAESVCKSQLHWSTLQCPSNSDSFTSFAADATRSSRFCQNKWWTTWMQKTGEWASYVTDRESKFLEMADSNLSLDIPFERCQWSIIANRLKNIAVKCSWSPANMRISLPANEIHLPFTSHVSWDPWFHQIINHNNEDGNTPYPTKRGRLKLDNRSEAARLKQNSQRRVV